MRVERNRASWISVAPVERRSGRFRAEGGVRLGVPVPTPARPGSGSKGCRTSHIVEPAVSQPPVGAPLGHGDYPQSAPHTSRLRFDDTRRRSGNALRLRRVGLFWPQEWRGGGGGGCWGRGSGGGGFFWGRP